MMQSTFRKSRITGFTLLEMLIALSLFAVLGILSNRILTTGLQIDERLKDQFAEQDNLRQLFLILHDDLEQLVPRASRSNSIPLLTADPVDGAITFVRGGYSNALLNDGKRSRLIKVRYAISKHPDRDNPESRYYRDEKNYLLRSVTHQLDTASVSATESNDEVVQVMMEDVSTFSLLPVFSGGGSTERLLPLLPNSVLVDMTTKQFGELRHTIMVR